MKTAYLVATFVQVGPFWFITRISRHSEPQPTQRELGGDKQFTIVLAHASDWNFEEADKQLQKWLERHENLAGMAKHLERFHKAVEKGVVVLSDSSYAKAWRGLFGGARNVQN